MFDAPEYFTIKVEGPVAILTMARKNDPYNMMNEEFGHSLRRSFEELDASPEIKALIITGSKSVFSSGADLVEVFPRMNADKARRLSMDGHLAYAILENIGLFTIAAINGFCLAGGLELALSCSYRIASTRARIGQTEVQVGVIPGWGGSQRLPRLIGRSKALRMILTAEILNAEEALEIGLVDEVVPHAKLMDRAMELASQVAKIDKELIRLAKKAVDLGLHVPFWYSLSLETELFKESWALPGREAILERFLSSRRRSSPPE
ncbi:MAG: enoyl-CoA hydratase/isomerase family protein [bacterium JZ-2024 1]